MATPRKSKKLDPQEIDRRYIAAAEKYAAASQATADAVRLGLAELATALVAVANNIGYVATAIDRGTTQLAVGMWHGRGLSPDDASAQAIVDRQQAVREVLETHRTKGR